MNQTIYFGTPKDTMKGAVIQARRYSKTAVRLNSLRSPLLFIPNENIYRFESENLSTEQNKAAIPNIPNFDHVKKYHFEITSPEFVADLVMKPDFNDILISSLSSKGVLNGDSNYKITHTSEMKEPSTLELHFTDFVIKWMELFNSRVKPLSEIPIGYELKPGSEKKRKAIESILSEFDNEKFNSVEGIHEFYSSFDLFNTKGNINAGLEVNIENISSYLVERIFMNDTKRFNNLLTYLESKIQHFHNKSIEQFTINLINALSKDDSESKLDKLKTFGQFYTRSLLEFHPRLAFDLPPHITNKLANILTFSSDLGQASKLLTILQDRHNMSPSTKDFDSFIKAYEASFDKSVSLKDVKLKVLRDLYNLKSIFFHNSLTPLTFKFLQDHVIDNIYDLHHLLKLAESKDSSSQAILKENSYSIISKLEEIQTKSSDSNFIKSLQLTQLVRRLSVNNNITFDDQTKALVKNIYNSLDENLNSKYVDTL